MRRKKKDKLNTVNRLHWQVINRLIPKESNCQGHLILHLNFFPHHVIICFGHCSAKENTCSSLHKNGALHAQEIRAHQRNGFTRVTAEMPLSNWKVWIYIDLILDITVITQKVKGTLQLCMMSQLFQTQWSCYSGAPQWVASIFKHNAFMLGCSGLNKSALSPFPAWLVNMDIQRTAIQGQIHQHSETFLPVPVGDVPSHQCSEAGAHHHCPYQVTWWTWSVQQ